MAAMAPGAEGDGHVVEKDIHRQIPLTLSIIMSDGLAADVTPSSDLTGHYSVAFLSI